MPAAIATTNSAAPGLGKQRSTTPGAWADAGEAPANAEDARADDERRVDRLRRRQIDRAADPGGGAPAGDEEGRQGDDDRERRRGSEPGRREAADAAVKRARVAFTNCRKC